jgi:hypothetical protein
MDQKCAKKVTDIITSLPQRNPYTKLKTELINRLSPSRELRARQLLATEEIGDRKPSQFLRHLRSLAPDMPDHYLRSIWLGRLPPNVRTHLAGRPEIDLDTTAHCANCILEATSPSAISSICQTNGTPGLEQRFEDLCRRVDQLATTTRDTEQRNRPFRRRSWSRNRRPTRRSLSRDDTATTTCWYHRRFGTAARKCTRPCDFKSKGKQRQQMSAETRLHYKHRPPLHHGQNQQTQIPDRRRIRHLRIPSQTCPTTQVTRQL